jgi:hypothetical protein
MQKSLLVLFLLLPQVPGGKARAPEEPNDERLRQAWSFLLQAEQADAMAWLAAEAPHLGTFQAGLVAHALGFAEEDPGFFGRAGETPYFAPETHAPRQPIPRRRLVPDDARARRVTQGMLGGVPPPAFIAAWRYDWGTGLVLRTADPEDPARLFENALAGFPPDADLAQALVERAHDDGALRAVHAAFEHAYTDREGNVYPLSLYDAWASGTEMEMPDVDCLGIVHTIDDEWKRWVAPVPPSRQDALYEVVGEHFSRARRHRGLRTALAMTYLSGDARLRDGYPAHLERLHSLWDRHASMPEELARVLPDPAGWAEFLEAWSIEVDRSLELTRAGQVRRATLQADAGKLRALLVHILTELGALERTARPAPPKPPKPPEDPEKPPPKR